MEIPGLRFEVLAYVKISESDDGEEGFVVCDRSEATSHQGYFQPFVCWKIGFPRLNPMSLDDKRIGDPIMWHGHYYENREDALRDMWERYSHFCWSSPANA